MLLCKQVLYFNSIKVRLKLHFFNLLIRLRLKFQFHKGTIKTELYHEL